MANYNPSPNMSLPVPVVGVDYGPDYATNLNSSLGILDAHKHTAGSGVRIPSDGININADLTYNSLYSATNIKKVVFTSQSGALSGTNFSSVVGGNLYFNDGSGNQIPITSAGGVAGSPGSIGSLASPASATYSAGSKTFTWSADSAKAAAMDHGAIIIRETNVASAKGVTIASASGLAADFQFTLPAALPASTQYMTSSTLGALSFSTSNTIVAAVTRPTGTTVTAGGVAISNTATAAVYSNTSYADITNLTVTITTSGRPVFVMIQSADTSLGMDFVSSSNSTGANATSAFLKIVRDSTDISSYQISSPYTSGGVGVNAGIPMCHVDAIGAGTYAYKVQNKTGSASSTMILSDLKLVAFEL